MKEKVSNDMSKESMVNGKAGKILIAAAIVLVACIIVVLLLLFNNKEQFKVTFDSNGGSLVSTIIVDENGLIVKPEDPTRENYVFIGWYYNDVLFDFSTPITENVTLEARWAKAEKVSGVELDQTKVTLGIGDTVKLIATVKPENAKDKSLTWSSSNPDVVKVDSNGNITALKVGSATITVTTKDGGYKAEAKVTVVKDVVNVAGVSLNKKSLNLDVNESTTLTATIKPSNATNKGVTWSSSNPDVATVNSKGKVTGKKAGTATITVTTKDGKYKATCTVKVSNVSVTGVSLNKTSLSLKVNKSTILVATVKPTNATNKGVTWSSSNPEVVTVNSNGKVTAKKVGTATITVTTKDGKYKAKCKVTVTEETAKYVVKISPKVQEGTGAVFQYNVAVEKNGSSFSSFEFIIYNGTKVSKNSLLASKIYNKNTSIATIRLSDGTDVEATVVYK